MSAASPAMFDAVIIGAGPTGLNAAQILARCRRRVVISLSVLRIGTSSTRDSPAPTRVGSSHSHAAGGFYVQFKFFVASATTFLSTFPAQAGALELDAS